MIKKRAVPAAYLAALQTLANPKVWVPLGAYFVLKMVILFSYVASGSGSASALWGAVLNERGRNIMTHYPGHLFVMPVVLSRIDIPLDVLLNGALQGVTILLVAAVWRKTPVRLGKAFSRAFHRYGAIVLVSAVAAAALYVCFAIPGFTSRFLEGLVPHSLVLSAVTFLGLVVQALFLLTLPLVVMSDRPGLAAIRESVASALHAPVATFLMVLIPFVLTIPTTILDLKSHALAYRLSPDILVHIQVATEVVQWLTMLLLIAGITVAYLWSVRDVA